jgi:hypothetical protein
LPTCGHVTNVADRLTTSVQVALLAERDQLLDEGTELLRLGQGRGDLLVLDQRRGHVGEHRGPVGARTAELAVGGAVAHRGLSYSGGGIHDGWTVRPYHS